MRSAFPGLLVVLGLWAPASAWGPDGHSVVAEIAEVRLSEPALETVRRLLGGRSLASIASWADDDREEHPETANWHFADIPLASESFSPTTDCAPGPKGDCVVAELDRLRNDLRCAADEDRKRDALRFAVHFVGDAHQPFHTVKDAAGGNLIGVAVYMRGVRCTGKCVTPAATTNLHYVWDVALIEQTAWAWGSMADLVEAGWLSSDEAKTPGIDGGTPTEWVDQTHAVAREASKLTPANFVLDEAYLNKARPIVERQLGLAGLRLARFLNEAYASDQCPVP